MEIGATQTDGEGRALDLDEHHALIEILHRKRMVQ